MDERTPDKRTTVPLQKLRSLVSYRRLRIQHKIGILGLIGLVFVPILFDVLLVRVLTAALFFAMFVMSWDVVSGYVGEISFGHSVFFTVGGYTSALLNLHLGLDPLITILFGVCLTVVVGALIGIPALRLEGPYLSLMTLIAPLVLLQIFNLYSDFFGGELGLDSPEKLLTYDDFAVTIAMNYYLAFGLFVLILGILLVVTRSDAGTVFKAIREDPDAVSASGISPTKFKLFSFLLSAAVAGLAGAVFVHTAVGNPQPSQLLAIHVNIEIIIAAIIGGMGTIVGAAIGGIFFHIFNDFLGDLGWNIPLVGIPVAEANLIIFYVMAILLLYYAPNGVVPWLQEYGRAALKRLRTHE